LIPGFLELRGSISGSLSSRLSSGLYLKLIKPKFENTYLIRGNIIASFILSIVISGLLGVLAFLVELFIFDFYFIKIIYISIIAGIIANVAGIIFSIFITFYIFRKGHDPNNITGPFITSIGDVISILSLLLAVVIL